MINANSILYPLPGEFSGRSVGKESACSAGDQVRKIPWRRKWQPTPIFLPGEFHRQRSLAGYCPWGRNLVTKPHHRL